MNAPARIVRRLDQIVRVSRETLEALDHLVAAVGKWSRAINLVADPRALIVWERHVLDSAQLFPLRHPTGTGWCDLGSGGGFPGLVVSVLGRELAPEQRFVLVESDHRKSAFLAAMVRDLNVKAVVHATRAESLDPQRAGTVSARALAPLDRLLGWVHRHLAPDGIALLPKGRGYAEEIAVARQLWGFTVDPVPSMLSAQSRILRVTGLRRNDAP